MKYNLIILTIIISLFSAELVVSANQDSSKLKLYSDIRIRAEHDWDSKKSDGTYRNDRTRGRYRLRFGFNYNWSKQIQFGGRFRSGNPKDQQSPHIDFGSEMEPGAFKIDKAFIKGDYDRFNWSLGKNSFPFWKQNELFWDDDVIPEGLSLGYKFELDETEIKPTLGGFLINTSSHFIGNDSKLLAGQIAIKTKISKLNIELATGLFAFDKLPTQNDSLTMNRLDYNIIHSGIKLCYDIGIPLCIGFDHTINLTEYNKGKFKDIVNQELKDEINSIVLTLKIGSLKNKYDWYLAYYYASVQKYSVVDYFAQDDWLRWDYGETGARSSNFSGHEIRAAYSFGKGFNCVLRAYVVEAIMKTKDSDLSLETGNRLRLDFNIKF